MPLGFLKISVKQKMLENEAYFGGKYIFDNIYRVGLLAATKVVKV